MKGSWFTLVKYWLHANSLPFHLILTSRRFIREPKVICLPVKEPTLRHLFFNIPAHHVTMSPYKYLFLPQGFKKAQALYSWDVMRLGDGTQLAKDLPGWPQWHHSKWRVTNRRRGSRDPRDNLRQMRTRAVLARTPTRCTFNASSAISTGRLGFSQRCRMHSVYRRKKSCCLSGDDR